MKVYVLVEVSGDCLWSDVAWGSRFDAEQAREKAIGQAAIPEHAVWLGQHLQVRELEVVT